MKEQKKIVCYFTNWAWYRKGDGKFLPEHIEPALCTDIIYAFASLEPNMLTITAFDPWADLDNSNIDDLHDFESFLELRVLERGSQWSISLEDGVLELGDPIFCPLSHPLSDISDII